MDNKEVLQGMKAKLEAYMSKLGNLDAQTINDMIKKYSMRMEEVLEYNGIRHLNIDDLIYQIQEEVESVKRVYSRKREREDEQKTLNRDFDSKSEQLDYPENAGEESKILSRATRNLEMALEDELKYGSRGMEDCLGEILDLAKKITLRELVRNGYFNLEQLEDDLNQSVRGLAIEFSDEYRNSMKSLNRDTLDQVYDDIENIREETIDLAEKLDIDPKEVYSKYEKGEITNGITLAPGELDIDVLFITEPQLGYLDDTVYKKGVCMSKSILDKAVRDGNVNLIDQDDANSKYSFIEQESYVMVLTSEENDRVQVLNQKRQRDIENREAKEAAKANDDKFDYDPGEQYF